MLSFLKNALVSALQYSNEYHEYKLKQIQKYGYYGWYY